METTAVRPSRRKLVLLLALALLACAAVALGSLLPRGGSEDAALEVPPAAPDAVAAEESPGMWRLDGGAMSDSGAVAGEATDVDVVVVASQEVVVTDVVAAGRRLAAEVVAAGGRVSAEYTTSSDGCPEPVLDGVSPRGCSPGPRSTITYRAPIGAVEGLLALTAELGVESWRTRSATDVGARVADVAARVTSARASLDRLNALMARAESLTDVIALESQIASRQAELESLLAQQAELADQTAMATVTATLATKAAGQDDGSSGFGAGLRAGLDALATAGGAVLTALGWALPFLAVIAALALPLLWWRRHAGRRKAEAALTPVTEGSDSDSAVAP